MSDWPDFSRTKAALEAYEVEHEQLLERLNNVWTDEEYAAWDVDFRKAREAVALAYWEDTKDRNSRETILQCMDPIAARKMVKAWEDHLARAN